MEHFLKRLIAATEPSISAVTSPYRAGVQAQDPTNVTSLISTGYVEFTEHRNVAVQFRFSDPTAVVTFNFVRGYLAGGVFTAQGVDDPWGITCPASGAGPQHGAKFITPDVPFSAMGANAFKIALCSSVTTGTVDIYARPYH